MLVLCALPLRITRSAAVALTGEQDAGKCSSTATGGISSSPGATASEPTYEFHALFREFLLKRAPAMFGADDARGLPPPRGGAPRSARAGEGVFELYRDAGEWPNAVRVALADAPEMLAQGRFESTLERVAALPAAAREAEPWLAYWEGVARVNVDPLARAREPGARLQRLRRARRHGGAGPGGRGGDRLALPRVGRLAPGRPLDRGDGEAARARARVREPRGRGARALEPGDRLVYRQPGHPLLGKIFDRLTALLEEVRDRNLQVAMATRLIDGLNKAGDFAQSQRIATRVRAVMDDPEVRPLTGAWCRVWLANLYYFQARFDDFERVLDDALAIAEQHGLAFFVPVIGLFRGWGRLSRGDVREAAPVLARLEATIDPGRKLDHALLAYLKCWSAAQRGDFPPPSARGGPRRSFRSRPARSPPTLICHTGLALALDQTGQPAAALGVLDRMLSLVADVRGGMLRYATSLWAAYLRLRAGEGDWRSPLADALALGPARAISTTISGGRR